LAGNPVRFWGKRNSGEGAVPGGSYKRDGRGAANRNAMARTKVLMRERDFMAGKAGRVQTHPLLVGGGERGGLWAYQPCGGALIEAPAPRWLVWIT